MALGAKYGHQRVLINKECHVNKYIKLFYVNRIPQGIVSRQNIKEIYCWSFIKRRQYHEAHLLLERGKQLGYIYISNVVIFGQFLIHLGMTEDFMILSFLFAMKAKSN